MNFNFRAIITLGFLLIPVVGMSGENVPLPSNNNTLSTIPKMERGKVKHISKDELPPDLREIPEKDIERNKHAYEEVPEAFFTHLSNYYNHLRIGPDAFSNVKVKLVDISMTKLAKYKYEGIIPEGPTIKGPWTNVTRVFRRSDGLLIKLTEWDFVADGGAIVIIDELMNSRVSDIPAFLSVKKSPSGKAVTTIEWATVKKQYTLSAEDNEKIRSTRKLSNKKWLLSLANAIAASDNK